MGTKTKEQVPNPTPPKEKLRRRFLREANEMRRNRKKFFAHSTLLDFAHDDACMMHGLFSVLNERLNSVKIERIMKACLFYFVNSEARDKGELEKEVIAMLNFHLRISPFRNLVAEKTFYYENLSDQLEEISKVDE